MKGNKLRTKIIGLIISLLIAIVLSAIISTVLYLIFTRVPDKIVNITQSIMVESILQNKEHFEMFILVIIAFMLFSILTLFKVSDLKDYKSKTYKVTDNIEIPLPIGNKQTQQGSAWWLSKRDFLKKFGVNRIDLENKEIATLMNLAQQDKENIKQDKVCVNEQNVNPIFKSGGLVIGKRNKNVPKIKIRTIRKFKLPTLAFKKVEDIYYIKDDLHSLTVGATRSGKTRSLVLQTIINTGLAGENMIISDPKR